MKGFVYSIPGMKDGTLDAVVAHAGRDARRARTGPGARLKLAQRERALLGIELIEWTYDPLQALNAHLNFASSAWWSRSTRRTSTASRAARSTAARRPIGSSPSGTHAAARRAPHREWGRPIVRDQSVASRAAREPVARGGPWLSPGPADLNRRAASPGRDSRRVHRDAVGRIRRSRSPGACTRARYSSRYFARGYRAVDFFLSREADGVTTCSRGR